ncbi:hypothetical protein [Brevundimonas sp.]|uniref:hypothetical protein n=1 Tax=Brevundimonas sp. TaxID=1871086 RepID=UPI002D07C428|nr:hypothetical protein [Brevundimonas sp.]HWQ86059.1 hypothetical protein [Brevundimonas sp.]
MSISLIAALLLQTAASPHGLICLSDPATGAVEVVLSHTGPDGRLEANLDGKWVPPRLEDRPEAAGLDWYQSGAPIVRDGVRYTRSDGTWSPGAAVNRYLRHVGLHEGAPLFSVWPGGDIDLAVLVRQDGCEFHVYDRERQPQSPPPPSPPPSSEPPSASLRPPSEP